MATDVLDPPASPALAAVLDLRAGRRREAIAGLAEAQRRDPGDPGITHMLLLACYHALRDGQATGRLAGEEAATLEERVIASWVALLHQDRFWTSWLDERLSRYGGDRPELDATREELIAELSERIEDLGIASDDPTGFKTLLRRELAAAGQLALAGGFPWPEGAVTPLVCGPVMIQTLGCAEAFGAFVAALPAGDGRFVRCAFSCLGLAEALLDLDRPAEAWAALAGLACPQCRAAAADGAPSVCAGSCPRFDSENPGYVGLADKAHRLERDALDLALRIQLALGHAAMTAAECDAGATAASFREALRLAAALGRREETEERVVIAVLGRVKALTEKDSLSAAIELLEAGREACGEAEEGPESAPREQLIGQLSEILARRGARAVEERRWDDAIVDLRRATALNPYTLVPLLSLSFALQCRARQLRKTSPEGAIELALEAVRHLQTSLADFIGELEHRESMQEARDTARSLILHRADEMAMASGFEQSLQILEKGLAELTGDPTLSSRLRKTVRNYARFLDERGQSERAVAVLRRLK
jgi:tetratricopeptide (TPR) repeat protein